MNTARRLRNSLLTAIRGDPNRYGGSVSVLQAFAGTAPISYQSGKRQCVRIRWACDKFMRHTVHLWADCFRRAVRCLGQRLLKIIFRMLADKKPYDPKLHARNQLKHGSWVLKLVPEAHAKAGE